MVSPFGICLCSWNYSRASTRIWWRLKRFTWSPHARVKPRPRVPEILVACRRLSAEKRSINETALVRRGSDDYLRSSPKQGPIIRAFFKRFPLSMPCAPAPYSLLLGNCTAKTGPLPFRPDLKVDVSHVLRPRTRLPPVAPAIGSPLCLRQRLRDLSLRLTPAEPHPAHEL